MKIITKKIIFILGFAVLAILIGWGIYYVFFKPASPVDIDDPDVTIGEQPTPGQLPDINLGGPLPLDQSDINRLISEIDIKDLIADKAQGGLTKANLISDQKVNVPAMGDNGEFNFYNTEDGRFYRLNLDGTMEPLSSQRFYGVENVVWDQQAQKAVIEYPDGSNLVYDFITDKQYSLPAELRDFSFSRNGQELAAEAIGRRNEANWIVTINSDGTSMEFITPLGDQSQNVDINFSPNNQYVALFKQNTSLDTQQIQLVGKNQENLPAIVAYGRGFKGQWTPQGDKILYSVYSLKDDLKPSLWLVDAGSQNIGYNNRNLNLQTWSDNCVINGNGSRAYCSVPADLPAGSGPYPDSAFSYTSSFYQIDLTTGQSQFLAQPVNGAQALSTANIFLAPDESQLYFQDAETGQLYSLNL